MLGFFCFIRYLNQTGTPSSRRVAVRRFDRCQFFIIIRPQHVNFGVFLFYMVLELNGDAEFEESSGATFRLTPVFYCN